MKWEGNISLKPLEAHATIYNPPLPFWWRIYNAARLEELKACSIFAIGMTAAYVLFAVASKL